MFNKLNREYKFFIIYLKERWSYFELLYDQYRCYHIFRPASINGQPAQICKFCDTFIMLSQEEYYTKFGELGWREWKKENK